MKLIEIKAVGKVAPRELAINGFHTLKDLAKSTEKELLKIHGVGPKAIRIFKEEMKKLGLSFKVGDNKS